MEWASAALCKDAAMNPPLHQLYRARLRAALKKRLRDGSQELLFHGRELGGTRTRSRAILLSDFAGYTSDQQYAPVMRNASVLHASAGINTMVMTLESALGRSDRFLQRFDTVGLKMLFSNSEDTVVSVMNDIRSRMMPGAKLIYFDGDDDLNVQWPRVIGSSDLYVKKHVFRDLTDYERVYRGKSNLSDFVARTYGNEFTLSPRPFSGPIPPFDVACIRLGWNIGLDDPIYDLAGRGMVEPTTHRPIDVCGRAPARKNDWVEPLRESMKISLRAMAGQMRVAVPEHRIPLSEYRAELQASSICVSPFGFGEVCWRDFEAVISGCLLVKPDMGHLHTEPNIYVPGVTYVPVAWDYSDLADVCAKYLKDVSARQRIVRAAQETLAGALRPEWFVERMDRVLR